MDTLISSFHAKPSDFIGKNVYLRFSSENNHFLVQGGKEVNMPETFTLLIHSGCLWGERGDSPEPKEPLLTSLTWHILTAPNFLSS